MAPIRVGIIHPDLGIGGAERLVVDAALGLQQAGYEVKIYTSHHDPAHAFEETKNGTLSVEHVSSWFPRNIFGRFHIVFAILSQLQLTTHILNESRSEEPTVCDVYMVDQLSASIPLLRAGLGRRVVYYCHFPDKLLSEGKAASSDGKTQGSLLKRLYRFPADWLEEFTTKRADVILANSKFTAGIFKAAFPSISVTPRVVYPGINITAYETLVEPSEEELGEIFDVITYPTLLSLNRIEGKKNLNLAIETFANVRTEVASQGIVKFEKPLRLVIGGGFDPRLSDNINTLTKLLELCATLGLSTYIASTSPLPASLSHLENFKTHSRSHAASNVTFLLNFTQAQRSALLQSKDTIALLYTPTNEHFGIGPVEGMICGLPVIACESGGPTESVISFPSPSASSPPSSLASLDPKPTGFLCAPNSEAFSAAVIAILKLSPADRAAVAEAAKARAKANFGMQSMTSALEKVLREAMDMGKMTAFMEPWHIDERTFNIVHAFITVLAIIACVLIYFEYL
ncbi:mannosyltransferase [Clavulina sp. PMI_390]|nr:mannosyltransferase [Clavulina sp. PMI_390]